MATRAVSGRLQARTVKSAATRDDRGDIFTKLAVAAIDFGTTYSGYAYSFHSDYKKDPLKVKNLNSVVFFFLLLLFILFYFFFSI